MHMHNDVPPCSPIHLILYIPLMALLLGGLRAFNWHVTFILLVAIPIWDQPPCSMRFWVQVQVQDATHLCFPCIFFAERAITIT